VYTIQNNLINTRVDGQALSGCGTLIQTGILADSKSTQVIFGNVVADADTAIALVQFPSPFFILALLLQHLYLLLTFSSLFLSCSRMVRLQL